jgi:hypothetical protein
MTSTTPQKNQPTRLEVARKKAAQTAALVQELEALERTRNQAKKRQIDTRKKVLLGAYLVDKIEKDPGTKSAVMADLGKWLTRASDRTLFGLEALPDAAAPVADAPGPTGA